MKLDIPAIAYADFWCLKAPVNIEYAAVTLEKALLEQVPIAVRSCIKKNPTLLNTIIISDNSVSWFVEQKR